MDPSLHIPLQHAATQNTPLKLRSTSTPATGKILHTQDVHDDLLVELEDATIVEDPLTHDSHYILVQCDQLSPSTDNLPQAPPGAPLKITSLEYRNQVLYHGDHWDPKNIPHILRIQSASTGSSRSQSSRSRRESINRVIPGTEEEETIEGTFLPKAGTEEECTAHWLNRVIEALMALDPSQCRSTAGGRLVANRFWSSETSCKPIQGNMMALKPDLILREKRSAIGPQQDFSWDGVISFLELTSSPYRDSTGVRDVCNAIMRKAYAIFASQPGRRFLFALSIAKQEFRVHMFDRAGVVHSRGYDIHRSPRILLRIISLLAFGDSEQIGYDITLSYSTPTPRLLSNPKVNPSVITVRDDTYTIIRKIFYGFLICGRATSCWHVKRNNRSYVVKDAWTHEGREFREEDILKKIKHVEGVPSLVDAWTVEIQGVQDRTRTRRSSFLSSDNEVRVHRRLVMQPVAIPLTDFTSIKELLSVLIDILDVHETLVDEFHVLHRDVSLNNGMMYKSSALANDGGSAASGVSSANDELPVDENAVVEEETHVQNDGGVEASGAANDELLVDENAVVEEETHVQKLGRWEQERRKMIQDGKLCRGILVDFDYATTIQPGQSKPVETGARTGTIPFMSANILVHYKAPDITHSANDDIESLIYVLIWICVLYAGPGTLRHDKHATETILKAWASVCTPNDAVDLGLQKIGIRSNPSLITADFTIYFRPLIPTVEKLLTALGTTWSATDARHNYKLVRDILTEGFGTVEEVPDWSAGKDPFGYGLLKMGLPATGRQKRKLPPFATAGYQEAESSTRRSVRRRY